MKQLMLLIGIQRFSMSANHTSHTDANPFSIEDDQSEIEQVLCSERPYNAYLEPARDQAPATGPFPPMPGSTHPLIATRQFH